MIQKQNSKLKIASTHSARTKRMSWATVVLVCAYVITSVVGGFVYSSQASAAIPKYINFQGKLTAVSNGTNVANGTYAIEFKIYDALTSGTLLWTETYDQAPTDPCQKIQVTNGVFNTKLGSCASLAAVDFTGGSLFLTVNFAPTGTSYDGEMSPRKQLVSSAFAFVANGVSGDGVVNSTVSSATALAIAKAGSNYALQVDTSVASAATGLKVTSAAATGGVALAAISSGTNENLTLNAKGSGTISIGNASTGNVLFGSSGQLSITSAGILSTTGNISTTGSGTVTSAGLLTSTGGLTSSGTITFSGLGGAGTKCLQTDNSGVVTAAAAACGTGALTPWTSDVDADGFDLRDLSNLEFRDTTGAPAGSVVAVFSDNTGDLNINSLTGKTTNIQVNGTDEYNFSSTALAMNSNNITGVGTAITATAGLTVTATAADLTLATATSGNITLAPASTGSVQVTSGVTTGTGTSSGLSVVANSLTTGVGVNLVSSSLSSGSLLNLAVTGTAATSDTQKALNVSTSGANATSTQTTYGGYFSNTHTGTSSTNVGGYFTASGGTNNYASQSVISNTSTSGSQVASSLSVTATPGSASSASNIGQETNIFINGTQNYSGIQYGQKVYINAATSGTVSQLKAVDIAIDNDGPSSLTSMYGQDINIGTTSVGSVTSIYGSRISLYNDGSTITNSHGLDVVNFALNSGTGPTNNVAVYVEGQTGGVNNVGVTIGETTGTKQTNLLIGTTTQPAGSYSVYNSSTDQNYMAGNFGLGDISPASLLTVGNGDLFQVNSSGAIAAVVGITNTGAQSTTVQSSTALTVARTGTNYALQVDTNTASSATGVKITSAAAAAGVAIAAISSGTDEALNIDAKGAGAINIGNTSTGSILFAGGFGSTGCTITTAGALSCDGAGAFSNLSGTNTGDVTLAAIGATPNANGATLTGQALNLQPANGSFGGVVSTTTQTFAGAKTFTSDLTVSKVDPSLVLVTPGSDTDFWLSVTDDAGNDDNDLFQIGDGATPGTNTLFSMDNAGNITLATGAYFGLAANNSLEFASGQQLVWYGDGNNFMNLYNGSGGGGSMELIGRTVDDTSGTIATFKVSPTVSPTSGTLTYAAARLYPTINQTGTATGVSRGLYVNPTITSSKDFRGMEASYTIAGALSASSNYGSKIAITNNQITNANTVYGQHISFTDAGSLANTVTGLYVDATTANSSDTTYSGIFQGGNFGIGDTTPDASLDIENASGDLFRASSGSVLRTLLNDVGGQDWYLSNGVAEKGMVSITTPGANPGIVIYAGATYDQDPLYIANQGSVYAYISKNNPYDGIVLEADYDFGIGTTAPDKRLEINSATGANLRLTYNDSDGSATNYADLLTTSSGDLSVVPSGGDVGVTGSVAISSILQVASATGTTYSRFGTGTTTHSGAGNIENSTDLLLSDDLEVDGDAWFDGNLTVTGTCTGCGGGASSLQGAYDGTSGNTITTTDARNIVITLANVATPTSLTIENQDTAGVSSQRIFNSIATGALTNGLLIEQTGAGTMTNGLQIAETAGAITDGILITGTLGNILNSGSIDITGAGAITGATGVTSATGNITATAGNLVATAGDLVFGATTRITNAGVGTFITGTVIGSQTFTTNNIADSGALTIASGAGTALTLDSGTTGAVNVGTGNNAKTISIGTGNAGNGINIGTDNTVADTIAIGSALDSTTIRGSTITIGNAADASVSIIDNNWSVTTAGVATFVTGSVIGSQTFTTNNIADSGALTIATGANGALTLNPNGTGALINTLDSVGNINDMQINRSGTLTSADSSADILASRTVVTNSAGSLNSTANFVQFTSNISGTGTDTGSVLGVTQSNTSASGAVVSLAGAGTGNLISADTTNSSANGALFDIQSSSASQYALMATVNNGGTTALRVGGDGFVGLNTTGADRRLDILDASNPQLRLSQADGTVYGDLQSTTTANLIVTGDSLTGSVKEYGMQIATTINQSSAAGASYSALDINVTETGTSGLNGLNRLADMRVGGSSKLAVANDGSILLQNASNIVTAYGSLGAFQNHLVRSEEFDNASWTKTSVTAPTANTQVGPDGSTTAESLATSGSGGDVCQFTSTAAGSDTFTFSVWARSTSGTQNFDLRIDAGATSCATANNVTGTAVTHTATTSWQRFSVTQTFSSATGNAKPRIFPGGTGGTGTIYAAKAQLEISSTANAYALTTGGALTNTNRGESLVSNFATTSGFTYGGRHIVNLEGAISASSSTIGQLIRVNDNATGTDDTATVRALEVQSFSGTNINGVNTAIAAFGYTFGVHAVSTGQANESAQPAAVFADLDNGSAPTQGNAIRAYSNNLTSADLVSFYQETTTFTGNGLEMNFGNSSGTFSGNFISLQKAGTQSFHVDDDGSTFVSFTGTQTSHAVCHATNGQTNDDELVDCTGTPSADYAEMYPLENGIEAGEIVAVGNEMVNTYDIMANGDGVDWNKVKGQVTRLKRTTSAYQKTTLGIVSDNYGDFISTGYNIKPEDNPKSVALKGRVLVKVTNENGAIKAGDYITSSGTLPGYGTKATRSGQVVGQALADYDFAEGSTGQVMVFVQTGYQSIGNTIVLDAPSTTSLNLHSGAENLTSNTASTFVIQQQSADGEQTNSPESNILQLQTGDANRFMVSSTGATSILSNLSCDPAAPSSDCPSVLKVTQANTELMNIDARGTLTLAGTIFIKDDSFAGSVATDSDGLAEITFSYHLGTGKPVVQLTAEAQLPVFAQIVEFKKDEAGNYTGFVMKTFDLISGPIQAIVHYTVVGKQADYITLGEVQVAPDYSEFSSGDGSGGSGFGGEFVGGDGVGLIIEGGEVVGGDGEVSGDFTTDNPDDNISTGEGSNP